VLNFICFILFVLTIESRGFYQIKNNFVGKKPTIQMVIL